MKLQNMILSLFVSYMDILALNLYENVMNCAFPNRTTINCHTRLQLDVSQM